MKKNKTLIYFIIAIILLFILLIFEKPFSTKMEEKVGDKLKLQKIKVFDKVTEKDTAKIFVSSEEGKTTFTLYNVNGTWALNQKGTAKADSYKINEAWTNISQVKEAEVISTNPDNFERFNLLGKSTQLTFYDKEGKVLEDIIIGKPSQDYQSTFIRQVNKPQVLKIPVPLSHIFSFSQREHDWRNKKIISQNYENINSITIEGPSGKIRVEKLSNGEWEIFEPKRKPASKITLDSISRVISSLYAASFEDNLDEKPLSHFALDPPVWKFTTTLKDGSSTPTLSIGKKRGDDEFYAMAKEDPQIYIIRSYQVDQLCKNLDDLLPTPTPPPTPSPKPEKKEKSEIKKEEKVKTEKAKESTNKSEPEKEPDKADK